MMFALLGDSAGRWVQRGPLWVSSTTERIEGEFVTEDGCRLAFAEIPRETMDGYLRFKRMTWEAFHRIGDFSFTTGWYRDFIRYSHTSAEKLLEYADEVDAFYINDFQQIMLGAFIGPAAPALLRWHIPFRLRGMPKTLRQFYLKQVEDFDAVVLSTRRDMEGLVNAGFRGKAYQIYPYVDPRIFPCVSRARVEEFRGRWHLGEGPVVLQVARMDPQKRQDITIRAFKRVRHHFKKAKLLLVGNGSFTADAEKKKGISTVGEWRRGLEKLVSELHLDDSVIFTGYLNSEEVHTAYEASDVLALSSTSEGFGLVGVEAWMHRRPVAVSDGAGLSELVIDGVNGEVVRQGSSISMATGLLRILKSPSRVEYMGAQGLQTSAHCHVRKASERLRHILADTIHDYRPALRSHKRPNY